MPQWLSSLLTKALTQVLAQKVPLLWALLSPILASGVISLRGALSPHLSDPTGSTALLAIALLAALMPLPFVAYFWFRPKFKALPWGVHQDIKTGSYFCSACLIPNKIHSSMFLSSDGRFWKCHSNSNHRRPNPEFKESPPPPQPSGPNAWMAG